MTALKEHAPHGAPAVPARPAGSTVGNPAHVWSSQDYPGDASSSGAFSPEDAARCVEWIDMDRPLRSIRPHQAQWRMEIRATQEVASLSGVQLSPVDAVWSMRDAHQNAACLAGQC